MILTGVRVVELAAWVAGPAAAGVLADWGADVVKVEPAAGDPQRSVFGAVGVGEQTSVPPFEIDNRGKRSVMLDLRVAGRAGRDGAPARRGRRVRDQHARRRARPPRARPPVRCAPATRRLVYGIITGYGLEGPDAHRPGYDVGAFWARPSLASSVVPAG